MARHRETQGDRIASGLTWRQLVELEACVRCGECQVWCPVFAQDGRQCITARGKLAALRKMIEGSLPEDERRDFLQGLYECSACGQCHVVCPVRIDTPELWEQARQALVQAGFPQPENQIRQLATIKEFNNLYGSPQSDRGRWADLAFEAGFLLNRIPLWKEKRSPVLYFAGCTASFDPETRPVAVQSARLLQEAGVEFSILGNDEPCCVGKLRRMGDADFAPEAKKRIENFSSSGIRTIVVSCAGCFKGLHSDYRDLWPEGYEVLHLTQFLDRLISKGKLKMRYAVATKVTYHDPCHLGRHNQIYDEPRRIIESVPGARLVEMRRHRAFSACCGMGGGLKVAHPEIQHRMSAKRIREAESTGAQAIVTPCQTCYLGLIQGLKETGSAIEIHHLNELLIRSICPEASRDKILEAFTRLTA